MITVRMLGGARKSFPDGTVTLDGDGITVSDLFGMLAGCKPPGTPELDTRNVLVAINGADSSVAGGLSATIQDGDRVDIIPVIHGGSPACRLDIGDIGVAALRVPSGAADPDALRRRFAGVRIQSINSEYILGASHLRRILEISVEAEGRGTMLTDRIETDMMLRLVGTTQISEAIRSAGSGAGPDAVVVALGNPGELDSLCEELSGVALPFPERGGEAPGCFGMVLVPPGRSLEDMLAERAAVL